MKSGKTSVIRLLFAVAVSVAALSASAELKIGIIGLDTSHVLSFTEIINVKKADFAAGARVVAAYQWGSKDIVSSTNRYPKYIAQMKDMGVEIVPTIDELIAKVDAVCLETNDGREHLWQAEKVFAAGKPCFIDKPLAHNLRDALKIVELGRKTGAKYFTSSALRYGKAVQEMRSGKCGRVLTTALVAPSPDEKQGTHGYYTWYGIHGFEPIVAAMGVGAERVTCMRNDEGDAIGIQYGDGRFAQLHLFRAKWNYIGYFLPERPADGKAPATMWDGYPGYEPLLRVILEFFRTGEVPVPIEETIEIFELMEAAEMSAKRGGEPVTLKQAAEAATGEASTK